MNKKIIVIISILLMNIITIAGVASLADDLFEFLTKNFSDDIVKKGLKITPDYLEKLIEKYGDEFISLTKKYGPDFVKYVDDFGEKALDLTKKYGDDALTSFRVYGDNVISWTDKFGDDIVKITSDFVGVDPSIITKYGDDLMQISSKIEHNYVLATVEAAKKGNADKVFSRMGAYGDEIIKYINKNSKAFAVMSLAGAIYTVTTDDERFNDALEYSIGETSILGKSLTGPLKFIFWFLSISFVFILGFNIYIKWFSQYTKKFLSQLRKKWFS
ncbi:MAG: hypothetical protein PWQ66_1007 [Petrotoga sp.]|jgi:hypothetical protein|nr:hypothetical protein [Petrotoga sp.]